MARFPISATTSWVYGDHNHMYFNDLIIIFIKFLRSVLSGTLKVDAAFLLVRICLDLIAEIAISISASLQGFWKRFG